jgi:bla regulator protein BlaR1
VIRRIVTTALLTCGIALGQTVSSQAIPASAPAKPLAFEVVSIRPSKPGTNMMVAWATTPDGYRVTGQPLRNAILMAYYPQGMPYWSNDRLSGAPAWLNDQYDIDARVSEADLAEWQKQGLALDKKPMFQQMLQSMLADRCHLVAHLVPGPPLSGWSLEFGKRAPRLTESKPGATLPAGVKLLDGGVMVYHHEGRELYWNFYSATMADLTRNLSINSMGHPVQDYSGLTGHYDFTLSWVDDPDSKMPEGTIDSSDPDPLSHWNIDALGLHLTPTKLPVDTLVIDHIERPSEN